jgi:hypothetical protein
MGRGESGKDRQIGQRRKKGEDTEPKGMASAESVVSSRWMMGRSKQSGRDGRGRWWNIYVCGPRRKRVARRCFSAEAGLALQRQAFSNSLSLGEPDPNAGPWIPDS